MNPGPPPSTLQTPGFAHYSLAWSPFHTNRIALASSANYGLIGNGRLHIVELSSEPKCLHLSKQYDTQDALYDVAWSEIHENQLLTASGDGSIKLWDIMLNDLPICAWNEHSREVFSVDWSNISKNIFASSSWDGRVKLWNPDNPRSLTTLQAHHTCVYQALFSPHQPDVLATCSTDGSIKIFDLRAQTYSTATNSHTQSLTAAALTVPAANTETLTIDWNKYRPFVLASAGIDKLVKVWDCRMVKLGHEGGEAVGGIPEVQLPGHEYAIRKLQWSPHHPDLIATASYDMSCRVWATNPPPGRPHLVYIHDPHTEFVVGCGWSLYEVGVLASSIEFLCFCISTDMPQDEEPEDILASSLQSLYDITPITYGEPGKPFTYEHSALKRPIILDIPETEEASGWSLHASSIWVSSIFLADHISELNLHNYQDLSILELGASAGLPGILLALKYPRFKITVSDYPDTRLIETLRSNVRQNSAEANCNVVPYAWGSPATETHKAFVDLKEKQSFSWTPFDVILAADTIWNPDLHTKFLHSLTVLLKPSQHSKVHLVAGIHTGRYTIQSFLSKVAGFGFKINKVSERSVADGKISRIWDVTRTAIEDEKERRKWVVIIVLTLL